MRRHSLGLRRVYLIRVELGDRGSWDAEVLAFNDDHARREAEKQVLKEFPSLQTFDWRGFVALAS